MKKFEYKVEDKSWIINIEIIEYLNQMGSEGWELVSIDHFSSWITYYWKREIIKSKYIETDPNL